MRTPTARRAAAVGLAVVAILASSGCSRHVGQPTPAQGSPVRASTAPASSGASGASGGSRAAAAATGALGTAIDHADVAASDQSSDLSAIADGTEGDPTQ